MATDPRFIRNFSIIAHIDHGKSTLSDRILELTGTVSKRDMTEQLLDSMDIERERGITIKSQAVRVDYTSDDGQKYQFNLIDTPGHVDFTYEVSRSLAACEGAVLVVDATQGVEAQTVANAMMAMNADLEIIPLINKIDLPAAEPERVKEEIEDGLAIPADDAILASGKTGAGIPDLLEAVVHMIPSPEGDPKAPLRALIFDSYFDAYRGVVALIRVVDGSIKKGDAVRLVNAKTEMQVEEVGARRPAEIALPELSVGEVGYLVTGLKDVSQVRVGDTITSKVGGVEEPLPGYREAKPMVYTGLFPIDGDQYEPLKEALEKLSLNDPALIWEAENSHALGFGFRVGFLGLLHMEVIKERLEREFGLDLIATAPSVEYHVYKTNGDMVSLHSPQDMPDPSHIDHVEEPYLKATIMIPPDYVGAVMDLTVAHRGTFKTMNYLSTTTVEMIWEIPSSELILDYFDQLKSRTKGYASLDYEYLGYKPGALQKLDILLSGKPIDALSFIVHKDKAYDRGRVLCEKLKEIIPQQMFEVPIQAAVGGRVLSRQTVRAKRKDVLAKCYGGDISRKRKLLEKQKAGKKRMKAIGNVEVPQEAFRAILTVDESTGSFSRRLRMARGRRCRKGALMETKKMYSVVFSATGSTKTIVRRFCRAFGVDAEEFDITREKSQVNHAFDAGDLVVFGVPSYGGRVPVPALDKIAACEGNGACAVLVVSYGNRDIDDTLLELADAVEKAGFRVVSAAAFVAQHSIFERVASGRPDAADFADIDAFAKKTSEKLSSASSCDDMSVVQVPGSRPYREFGGVPFIPEIVGACTACARCALECPVGAISFENPKSIDAARCISCMRCVAVCPLKGRSVRGLKFKMAAGVFAAKHSRRQGSRIYL